MVFADLVTWFRVNSAGISREIANSWKLWMYHNQPHVLGWNSWGSIQIASELGIYSRIELGISAGWMISCDMLFYVRRWVVVLDQLRTSYCLISRMHFHISLDPRLQLGCSYFEWMNFLMCYRIDHKDFVSLKKRFSLAPCCRIPYLSVHFFLVYYKLIKTRVHMGGKKKKINLCLITASSPNAKLKILSTKQGKQAVIPPYHLSLFAYCRAKL
jgi:hypothetical protein